MNIWEIMNNLKKTSFFFVVLPTLEKTLHALLNTHSYERIDLLFIIHNLLPFLCIFLSITNIPNNIEPRQSV
jgi:hypothetical protein